MRIAILFILLFSCGKTKVEVVPEKLQANQIGNRIEFPFHDNMLSIKPLKILPNNEGFICQYIHSVEPKTKVAKRYQLTKFGSDGCLKWVINQKDRIVDMFISFDNIVTVNMSSEGQEYSRYVFTICVYKFINGTLLTRNVIQSERYERIYLLGKNRFLLWSTGVASFEYIDLDVNADIIHQYGSDEGWYIHNAPTIANGEISFFASNKILKEAKIISFNDTTVNKKLIKLPMAWYLTRNQQIFIVDNQIYGKHCLSNTSKPGDFVIWKTNIPAIHLSSELDSIGKLNWGEDILDIDSENVFYINGVKRYYGLQKLDY